MDVTELVLTSPPAAGAVESLPEEPMWPDSFQSSLGVFVAMSARVRRLFGFVAALRVRAVRPVRLAAIWCRLRLSRRLLNDSRSSTDPSALASSLVRSPGAPSLPVAA